MCRYGMPSLPASHSTSQSRVSSSVRRLGDLSFWSAMISSGCSNAACASARAARPRRRDQPVRHHHFRMSSSEPPVAGAARWRQGARGAGGLAG